MKLFTELNENVELLVEKNDKGEKSHYIKGIFMQAEHKNRNGRVYPINVLDSEVGRYNENYVKKSRAFGELGHPEGPTINLERVSHMITDLQREGTDFVGKAKIMGTPYGNIVKNLIDEGAKLGVSSRGMGSLKQSAGVGGAHVVQDDYHLATAADIVADPSAPNAFVEGIMEGKEWVWENGVLQEVELARYRKRIDESSRKDREEVKLKAFEDFLSKL
tara:strand:+ start:3600 stop:4256 length:657 start_codon:yes stop_codon:yes gene_type:complete